MLIRLPRCRRIAAQSRRACQTEMGHRYKTGQVGRKREESWPKSQRTWDQSRWRVFDGYSFFSEIAD
jgi:hypothetical protein